MTLATTPRPVDPDPRVWVRLVAVLRGLRAVLVAFTRIAVTAPAALLSARLGTPPGWLRRTGRRIAGRYRLGYHNACEGEVIDDQDDHEEERR
ncbi:hypothetical protein [Spirillospora sp. CA-128828]|uniref:hypothetical protein n=1 Tax=Spirillospora sp. CA-128828 TaxID=3240033 RepID=UPI003D8F7D56